jgi:hypothetical protein
MSKMDDMRAMREARYEAAKPRTTKRTTTSSPEELCGHRAISGRTCTRDKGHAAKSHRYS